MILPYTTPSGAVFPYSPEDCPRHRLFCQLINGRYQTRCSLCNASFRRIDRRGKQELKMMKSNNEPRLCRFCGQPMRPYGVKKRLNEYDHAKGCPYAAQQQR